ncbi:MAG: hypothetical protein KBF83_02760 [Pyrinomonadaceae bacterium]|nr:hypothetical protein [Pyrinomonadaceae bacterium]MBP9108456.1 hypothetical protein [Pyrinomonadaceae bacterium]
MKLQKHIGRMVLGVFGLLLLAGTQDVLAQGLPTNSRTMVAVKAAMPSVTVESHEFTSDWKLERESGYTFSNLAKRAIKMQVRDNKSGQQRSFEGLAIYQRGAANDAWRWSRFFTYENSIKMIGATEDTAEIERMTLESMTFRPSEYFGDLTGVYWVHPIKIVPGSFQKRSDKQMAWQVEFKVTRRWDHTFLVERHQTKAVDAYLGQDGKTWTYSVGSAGEKELSRQERSPSALDAMPNMQAKGFKALYGSK